MKHAEKNGIRMHSPKTQTNEAGVLDFHLLLVVFFCLISSHVVTSSMEFESNQ